MVETAQVYCTACNSHSLQLKYVATYEYSYVIDADAPGLCNNHELRSYLYDNRKQTEAKQYIECITCGAQYPFYSGEWHRGITASALQRVIAAGSTKTTS